MSADCIDHPLSICTVISKEDPNPPHHLRRCHHDNLHLERGICCSRSHYPCGLAQVSRTFTDLSWNRGDDDGSMDCALLHADVCHCRQTLEPSDRRIHSDTHERRICCWGFASRMAPYPEARQLLHVCTRPEPTGPLLIRHFSPSLVVFTAFPITLAIISMVSKATTPASLYILMVFLNGFSTGAALNYTLAHVLHLTPKSTHYIVTSLLATFRGFAGSFGSAVGGGLFIRTLRDSLENGFREASPGEDKQGLIRVLLGSPGIVSGLEGTDRVVAVKGYEDGLKTLFLAGAGLAALMILVQAGTGWRGYVEESSKEDVDGANEEAAEGNASLTASSR